MNLSRYVVVPQKRGRSQRITLPLNLLKSKNWLKTDCYVIEDNDEDEVIIKTYSDDLNQHYDHPQPQLSD